MLVVISIGVVCLVSVVRAAVLVDLEELLVILTVVALVVSVTFTVSNTMHA